MLKTIIKLLLRLCFRVKVYGIDHVHEAGNRVIIIANHVSVIDSLLVKLFLPCKMAYAIDEVDAKQWWSRPFVKLLEFCVVNIRDPLSVKKLIDYVSQDNRILIFSEFRVSRTGSLMKVYPVAAMVADRSQATILPVHIAGAEKSIFSACKGTIKRRLFPRIELTVSSPAKMCLPEGLKGQARRDSGVEYMIDLMRGAKFRSFDNDKTLFEALADSGKYFGWRYPVLEDIRREPLTYRDIVIRSILLGRCLDKQLDEDETAGVLMPTSSAATVLIFALHVHGHCPAMLNYGAGTKALLSCIENADIKRVYTSRRFIQEGGLHELLDTVRSRAEVFFLEDLLPDIRWWNKVYAALCGFAPRLYYKRNAGHVSADDTAVLLFTSGSEGLPKGVVLTHKNILSNCRQVSCILDFTRNDLLLNILPIFHSFGLTAGTLLPMVLGVRVFQYPSPLHYKIIPELVYDLNATIIFATNTFLNGYARHAHHYDFTGLRYVFAGAEPLTEQTENKWMEKFGIRVLQGYGVTETSPVLSANTPLTCKRGSVGKMLPGIEWRLVDVEGIEGGKRLQVKGPNVMKGYLLPDQPGELIPPSTEEHGDAWYDTGDIVSMDEDHYLFIRGRAKRFAKIGGEMISLRTVEDMVSSTWPEHMHAVIYVRDSRRGEQLILFTEYEQAGKSPLVRQAREEGLSELHIPRQIEVVPGLPILPSGKIDYVALQERAEK